MFNNFNSSQLMISQELKEKIEENIKSLQTACDLSKIDIGTMREKFDFATMDKQNAKYQNNLFKNIAKLSIDYFSDYDYYKEFTFRSKFQGKDYEDRLRMLGFKEKCGFWFSVRKPEKDTVMENVFLSCLYRSINAKLMNEKEGRIQIESGDNHALTGKVTENNNFSIKKNKIKQEKKEVRNICPFCENNLKPLDYGCHLCKATKNEIANFIDDEPTQCVSINSNGFSTNNDNAEIIKSTNYGFRTLESILKVANTVKQDTIENQNDTEKTPLKVDEKKQDIFFDRYVALCENENEVSIDVGTVTMERRNIMIKKTIETVEKPPPSGIISNDINDVKRKEPRKIPKYTNEGNKKWKCKYCLATNPEHVFSCQSCMKPELDLWSYSQCTSENELSLNQCFSCGIDNKDAPKEYCQKCHVNEIDSDSLCKPCQVNLVSWACWYRYCKSKNIGNNKYCKYCGVDRFANQTSGAPVQRCKDGVIDQIWICDKCCNFNKISSKNCQNYRCYGSRNKVSRWCGRCGYGNPLTGYPHSFSNKCVVCKSQL